MQGVLTDAIDHVYEMTEKEVNIFFWIAFRGEYNVSFSRYVEFFVVLRAVIFCLFAPEVLLSYY